MVNFYTSFLGFDFFVTSNLVALSVLYDLERDHRLGVEQIRFWNLL